jgi:hypothetical protein
MNKWTLISILASSTALAACWGDSDGSGPVATAPAPSPASPTAGVPASASSSIDGMVSYLVALVGVKNDNTDEPVDVGSFAPPTSNTTEPAPLPTLQ